MVQNVRAGRKDEARFYKVWAERQKQGKNTRMIDLSKRRKLTTAEWERLGAEIEKDPTKRPFWRPYNTYTWLDILTLWTPDNGVKPH
jgi:hypothetical protein